MRVVRHISHPHLRPLPRQPEADPPLEDAGQGKCILKKQTHFLSVSPQLLPLRLLRPRSLQGALREEPTSLMAALQPAREARAAKSSASE